MTARAEAVARREDLEAPDSPHALLTFVVVDALEIAAPLRLVLDPVDHEIGGVLYTGMVGPVVTMLQDGDGVARSRVTLPNVDRRIGDALRAATGRIDVSFEMRSSADFDLSVVPRLEVAGGAPVYAFRNFALRNVQGDAVQITGDLMAVDPSVAAGVCLRATQARLPGLWRS